MQHKITCTRRLEFDTAHRVVGHEGKCKLLHGHRYTVEATFTAVELDKVGRIVDFAVIKEKLGEWLDNNWDHNTVLWKKDKELGEEIDLIIGQKVFYLPYNPTVEHMAYYLLHKVCTPMFKDDNLKCTVLRLYETPNCYAEVKL